MNSIANYGSDDDFDDSSEEKQMDSSDESRATRDQPRRHSRDRDDHHKSDYRRHNDHDSSRTSPKSRDDRSRKEKTDRREERHVTKNEREDDRSRHKDESRDDDRTRDRYRNILETTGTETEKTEKEEEADHPGTRTEEEVNHRRGQTDLDLGPKTEVTEVAEVVILKDTREPTPRWNVSTKWSMGEEKNDHKDRFFVPGITGRFREQIEKRKLLWQKKETESKPETVASAPTYAGPGGSRTTKVWEATTFAQDTDGKVANKFKRLMGIKSVGEGSNTAVDVLKKQEEMFSSMEQQYEVARTATHTMRGVGLGFGSYQR
ncbi:hypothetical protein NQ314_007281 [Rhamnusium bicolor]|uniref:Small acidic protein-like domain-containing protein n=1 Tax=Rhamnusium bicolor TaxID=1586634 RepID=A0AAV8YRZ9_9CUCU|nr:hypothetical protein NQ314_007281 [Rhamnusium bicolor]